MLILYRIALVVILILIAVSFAQGAKSHSKNAFIWSCIGVGIFISCGILVSAPIYYFSRGPGTIVSIVSPVVMIGIPLLITYFLRKKFLPATPLLSISKNIPIILILVITVGLTLFLIGNEINNSLLVEVVRSAMGSRVGMAQVANAKGALIIICLVGWVILAANFIYSKRRN